MRNFLWLLFLSLAASPVHAEMIKSSLEELVASGQPVSCTFSKALEDGSQSGTVYVGTSKMRGDMQVTSSEGSFPMHIIRDGDWTYTWGGPLGDNQGVKLKASTAQREVGSSVDGPDMAEQMDMECQPWSVEESRFEIPSDVQFMELGSLGALASPSPAVSAGIPGGAGGSIDMKQMQCAACNQIPEDQRQQCLQILGC
jgi:hypothetical protein